MRHRQNRIEEEKIFVDPQLFVSATSSLAHSKSYDCSEELISFIATMMQKQYGYVDAHSGGNLSNLIWSVAMIISPKDITTITNKEQHAAFQIMRRVTIAFIDYPSKLDAQALSLWILSLGLTGFGDRNAIIMMNQNQNEYETTNILHHREEYEDDPQLLRSALELINLVVYASYHELDTRALSNIALSLGRFEERSPDSETKAILRQIAILVSVANYKLHSNKQRPFELANTAWGLSALGVKHTPLMERTKNEMLHRMTRYINGEENNMTSWYGSHIAKILLSLSKLNINMETDMLQTIAIYGNTRCQDSHGNVTQESIKQTYTHQSLCNMAWACALSNQSLPYLMHFIYLGLFGDINNNKPIPSFRSVDVRSIINVQVAMDMLDGCDHDRQLPQSFPHGWLQHGENVPIDDINDLKRDYSSQVSQVRQSVYAAFRRLGCQFVQCHPIWLDDVVEKYNIHVPSMKLAVSIIDIAIPETKIAIMIIGRNRYIRNINDTGVVVKLDDDDDDYNNNNSNIVEDDPNKIQKFEMDGTTVLKHRILTTMGWTVIHIPYWEWDTVSKNTSSEEQYCR